MRHAVRVMTAISSSPRNTTSRVWLRIAGMSDATKNSPSPSPTTIGGPFRAATILSGSSAEISTSAKRPRISMQRPAHRVFETVVLHLALDEMRDDFGVGLGDERVALPLQLLLQIEIVLDDAVVHDDDLAGAVAVRMGVLLGRAAVRRPARVADAVVAGVAGVGSRRMTRSRFDSLPALRRSVTAPVADDRDAGRIVAAVFQTAAGRR